MAKRKAKPIHRRRTKGVDRFVVFIAFVEFIGFGESIGFVGFVGFIAFIGSIGFVVFACPAVAGLSSLRSSSSVEHKAGYRMRDAECGMRNSGYRMENLYSVGQPPNGQTGSIPPRRDRRGSTGWIPDAECRVPAIPKSLNP